MKTNSNTKIKANEYLTVWDGKRHQLVQALADSNQDRVYVVYDKDRLDDEKKVETTIDTSTVTLNLGLTPKPGSVYGCKVEPYSHTVESDAWGSIHFFRKMDKPELQVLKTALKEVHAELSKKASLAFLPLGRGLHIRPQQGKYAGFYHYHSVHGDCMTLRPSEFDLQYLKDVLFHEAGHGMEHRVMPRSVNARWVKLYTRIVKLGQFDYKTLQALYENIKDAQSVDAAYEGLGEDEVSAMDACIGYVCSTFSLSKRQLDMLLEENLFNEDYWPTHDLDNHDYEEPLGEYAAKNPSEFFAEAFRFQMMGHKLPKSIQGYMDKTLAIAKKVK